MEILRSFQIECVNLGIASQKTARDHRRKCDALPAAGEQRVVARIIDETRDDLAFNGRSFLRLNEGRGARVHVKNVDVLQDISQGSVHVRVDWLAQLKRDSVIALVVLGAQVIRLGEKGLATQRKTSIEEVRFGDRQNKIFSLGSILKT